MKITAETYATQQGIHPETVRRWCRNAMKPAAERNKHLPPIACRKLGRIFFINPTLTEKLQLAACACQAERVALRSHFSR